MGNIKSIIYLLFNNIDYKGNLYYSIFSCINICYIFLNKTYTHRTYNFNYDANSYLSIYLSHR